MLLIISETRFLQLASGILVTGNRCSLSAAAHCPACAPITDRPSS